MKKDISIIVPSIRPQFLDLFYQSIEQSCQNHTWEMICPGPFDVSAEMRRMPNVKILKTYAHPTAAIQMGMMMCSGRLVYYGVDDQLLLQNVLDEVVDMFDSQMGYKDVVNMRYHEDPTVLNYKTMEFLTDKINPVTNDIWLAHIYPDLRLPGVKPHWRLAPLFCMNLQYFYALGGLDCRWEYSNYPVQDLIFRVQEDGGRIVNSPSLMTVGAWQPNHIGDHGPVHDGQIADIPVFRSMYSDPDCVSKRIKINYDNWKDYPDAWGRRFGNAPLMTTREEYEERSLPNWKNESGVVDMNNINTIQ